MAVDADVTFDTGFWRRPVHAARAPGCSVQFGTNRHVGRAGIRPEHVYLIVTDIEAARDELTAACRGRGVSPR